MSDAKAEILQRVRDALARSQRGEAPEPPRGYRAEGPDAPGSVPVVDQMVQYLRDYDADVQQVTQEHLADAIDRALADCRSVVVPDGLPAAWKRAAARSGRAVEEDSREHPHTALELDRIDGALTASRCAVSSTGTIVLDGEPDQGRRALTLVPDHHTCVLFARDVYPTVPQAFAVLGAHPERPITWIAGPSATSDIELVRVNGVHGPRHLHVILVEDGAARPD